MLWLLRVLWVVSILLWIVLLGWGVRIDGLAAHKVWLKARGRSPIDRLTLL